MEGSKVRANLTVMSSGHFGKAHVDSQDQVRHDKQPRAEHSPCTRLNQYKTLQSEMLQILKLLERRDDDQKVHSWMHFIFHICINYANFPKSETHLFPSILDKADPAHINRKLT